MKEAQGGDHGLGTFLGSRCRVWAIIRSHHLMGYALSLINQQSLQSQTRTTSAGTLPTLMPNLTRHRLQ